jgi:hypothetical protein
MHELIGNNETEVQNFLASGKSYSQAERDRLCTFFEAKNTAKRRVIERSKEIKQGKKKAKKHTGNMENYQFDHEEFLKFIRNLAPGSRVIWRYLALKFHLKTKKGIIPTNAGQVLKTFATLNGVDCNKFNTNHRVSGRDFLQRIRRARQKIHRKVSIPTPRSSRALRAEIQRKLGCKELYVGEKIAPKIITSNKIDGNGRLLDKEVAVYGRMIPLAKIMETILDNQKDFRRKTDVSSLTQNDLEKIYKIIGEDLPSSEKEAKEKLTDIENTFNLKIWHDHSDILNHSYYTVMISTLYDPACYLTNEEYMEMFPERPPVDIQGQIERPYLYILGQSSSSDIDQLSYILTRIEDLKTLRKQEGESKYILRFFSGDGPARQFEAGHQRGGNYSCLCGIKTKDHANLEHAYSIAPPSLKQRAKVFKDGTLWKKFSLTNPSPFANLKKEDLAKELRARGHDTVNKNKGQLQEELSSILTGIQRPPALMTADDISDLLEKYEIPPCEPLHDITNVVQNIITELPCHIENLETQKEFEKFQTSTIGDKNQLKGSDARLFAVKLAMFVHLKFLDKKISKDIYDLCTTLVEIISICYSQQRTTKKILRLYNLTFKFSLLSKSIIGVPKKMTTRKFFGCHFHCLTVHAPETYRMICLRSLVPEQEERTFGDLRSISQNTANRQCGRIIDNAVLRFNAQQMDDTRKDYVKHQESVISHQAKFLPKSGNSTFNIDFVLKRSTLFQAHYQRIADFMLGGQDMWWSLSDGMLTFHDGPEEPDFRAYPPLRNFRSMSCSNQQSLLAEDWRMCVHECEASRLSLPLPRIKIHQEGELCRIFKNEGMF